MAGPATPPAPDRKARLAAALKANLRRRKADSPKAAQARRDEAPGAPDAKDVQRD
jgi:hypothetical protein